MYDSEQYCFIYNFCHEDMKMQSEKGRVSRTKGRSMFLPGNFKHRICWSDLPVIFKVRYYYKLNLPGTFSY